MALGIENVPSQTVGTVQCLNIFRGSTIKPKRGEQALSLFLWFGCIRFDVAAVYLLQTDIQAVDGADQFVMEHEADDALVTRLWRGELPALGILYDRHGSVVYGIALKGLRSVVEAEDLTQDVFLSLMRTRSYDSCRGTLPSYLTTLTRSRVIDRLRAQSTRKKYLQQWRNTQSVADSVTPMKHITQQEQRALVREALTTLKSQQREVLEMSYYEGRSQSDIAERLGVPLGTVKSWARRGLLQLRKQLDVLREDV